MRGSIVREGIESCVMEGMKAIVNTADITPPHAGGSKAMKNKKNKSQLHSDIIKVLEDISRSNTLLAQDNPVILPFTSCSITMTKSLKSVKSNRTLKLFP